MTEGLLTYSDIILSFCPLKFTHYSLYSINPFTARREPNRDATGACLFVFLAPFTISQDESSASSSPTPHFVSFPLLPSIILHQVFVPNRQTNIAHLRFLRGCLFVSLSPSTLPSCCTSSTTLFFFFFPPLLYPFELFTCGSHWHLQTDPLYHAPPLPTRGSHPARKESLTTGPGPTICGLRFATPYCLASSDARLVFPELST